jgi:hypothetical protein
MNILKRIGVILTDPHAFFKHIQREQGIRNAFAYLAVLLFVSTALEAMMAVVTQPYAAEMVSMMFGIQLPQESLPVGTMVFHAVLGYVVTVLIGMFVIAGLLHVWCLLFGGKAGYSKTYQLNVYSYTPAMLFGWIPIVSFFAGIWSLVLLIIGTQHVHGIGRTKAILMYLIPYALMLMFAIVIMLFAVTVFQNAEMISQ